MDCALISTLETYDDPENGNYAHYTYYDNYFFYDNNSYYYNYLHYDSNFAL